MTVAELIKELQEYPQDAVVLVDVQGGSAPAEYSYYKGDTNEVRII